MKKLLSLLVAFALVLGTIGCNTDSGSSGGSNKSTKPEEKSGSKSVTAKGEPVKIAKEMGKEATGEAKIMVDRKGYEGEVTVHVWVKKDEKSKVKLQLDGDKVELKFPSDKSEMPVKVTVPADSELGDAELAMEVHDIEGVETSAEAVKVSVVKKPAE